MLKMNKYQKPTKMRAFTLAEVLITLAIIGVVAAMTIPTLVARVQNKELETAFKKSYSMLQNAYRKAYFDNGDSLNFDNKTDVDLFLSNFKIASATMPTGYTPSTIKEYDKASNATNGFYIEFYFENSTYRTSYVLADGSMIGIYSYSGGVGAGNIVVDTNGVKGPNRLGYDVFTFTNKVYGNTLSSAGAAQYMPPDWLYPSHCTPASMGGIGSGAICTYYAILNQCPWDSTKTYWETLP